MVYSVIVSMKAIESTVFATLTTDSKSNVIMGGLFGTSIYHDIDGISYRSFGKATGKNSDSISSIVTLHTDYKTKTSYCVVFVNDSSFQDYRSIGTKTANSGYVKAHFKLAANKALVKKNDWRLSHKLTKCLEYLREHSAKMARLNKIIEA